MKKEYTQFRDTSIGKDFLEFQRDIVIFCDILSTHEDEKKSVITAISIDHLRELRKKLTDKYTENPFRNATMQKWHAHLGKQVKEFTNKMKNDETRPGHITILDTKNTAHAPTTTPEIEDNSWMEDTEDEEDNNLNANEEETKTEEESDKNPDPETPPKSKKKAKQARTTRQTRGKGKGQ